MNLMGSAVTVRYDASTNRFTIDKETIIKNPTTEGFFYNHIKHREDVSDIDAQEFVREFFSEIPKLLVNNA